MSFIQTLKQRSRKAACDSDGTVAGIYLRPERRSVIQFPVIFLGKTLDAARGTICDRLDNLFAQHGESNISWYVERSLGPTVTGAIGWCNMDISDCLID